MPLRKSRPRKFKKWVHSNRINDEVGIHSHVHLFFFKSNLRWFEIVWWYVLKLNFSLWFSWKHELFWFVVHDWSLFDICFDLHQYLNSGFREVNTIQEPHLNDYNHLSISGMPGRHTGITLFNSPNNSTRLRSWDYYFKIVIKEFLITPLPWLPGTFLFILPGSPGYSLFSKFSVSLDLTCLL